MCFLASEDNEQNGINECELSCLLQTYWKLNTNTHKNCPLADFFETYGVIKYDSGRWKDVVN